MPDRLVCVFDELLVVYDYWLYFLFVFSLSSGLIQNDLGKGNLSLCRFDGANWAEWLENIENAKEI